jgi:hypothetical protein
MTRPGVRALGIQLALLAAATGLALLAASQGNTALMWVTGIALAVTEGCVLLAAAQRLPRPGRKSR